MTHTSHRVLIADDEKTIRETLARILKLEGFDPVTAENGLAAQRMLQETPFDALVLDLRMPGMDGLDLLAWMRGGGPQTPVVVVSAHGDVADAVTAMKRGAADYVTKPFDPDDLVLRIQRAIADHRLRQSVTAGRDASTAASAVRDPRTSENETVRNLMTTARRVAPTDTTVLITGESGTGKEVLARMIHRESGRADGPFVPINLGAVPETLLESELFGHERGAFTGADSRKPGLFETAAGGTLFLDEIGDMPVHLQVKLLRAIQDRKIQRVGGTGTIPVDLRILAATNRDLAQAIADGSFREDLYYRLNVIELRLPPLRERPEDIGSLVGAFLDRIRNRGNSAVTGIEPDAIRLLQRYPFPGNIRELENIVERAALLSDAPVLSARDFSFLSVATEPNVPATRSVPPTAGTPTEPRTLADLEAEAIYAALLRNQGHRERTASELGITRRTLLNKIKAYNIPVE